MIFIIFIPIFFSSIYPEDTALQDENQNHAAYFCSKALESYASGNISLANHFLKRCKFHSPEYLENSAEMLKLAAILHFRKNDRDNFIFYGKKSTALKKDPLFSYQLAAESLGLRKAEESYHFLNDALSQEKSLPENTTPEAEGLFSCSIATADNPIGLSPANLSEKDASLALFQKTALAKVLKRDSKEERSLLTALKTASQKENDRAVKSLFQDPFQDSAHIACIQMLKSAFRTQESSMTEERRSLYRNRILLLYKNRIAFTDSTSALHAYGSALLEFSKSREALHTFRLILKREGWQNLSENSFPGIKFSEPLRRIGEAYRNIQQKSDAETVFRMADTIENADALHSQNAAYRRNLLNRAGENLNCREALLLLEADALWRKDKRSSYYADRRMKRDLKMEGKELTGIFSRNFPF